LIEKTRTAVTDRAGQFKIEQLRGGVIPTSMVPPRSMKFGLQLDF